MRCSPLSQLPLPNPDPDPGPPINHGESHSHPHAQPTEENGQPYDNDTVDSDTWEQTTVVDINDNDVGEREGESIPQLQARLNELRRDEL